MSSPDDKSKRSSKASPDQPQPVKFLTEMDSSFRIYPSDGIWGMVNHSGVIQLNFFVEHPPMPKEVVYRIDEKGVAQTPPEVSGPTDNEHLLVVRSFQTAVALSLPAAQQVYTVLGNFIKLSENMAPHKKP